MKSGRYLTASNIKRLHKEAGYSIADSKNMLTKADFREQLSKADKLSDVKHIIDALIRMTRFT